MKEKELKQLKLTKNIIIPFPNFQQNTIISPTQMNDNFEEIEYAYNNLIDNHNGAITKINKALAEITSSDNEAISNEQARVQAEEIRVQNEEQRISDENERRAEEKKRIAMYNTHMNDETNRQQAHREMVSAFNSKVSEVDNAIASIPSKEELKGEKGDNGVTPSISIGTVTTLKPNQQATVTRRGTDTDTNPIFDFGIPKGEKGETPSIAHLETNISNKISEVDELIHQLTNNRTIDGGEL